MGNIFKIRCATVIDENMSMDCAKSKIIKSIAKQIEPYITFNTTHCPTDSGFAEMLNGTLFVATGESEE